MNIKREDLKVAGRIVSTSTEGAFLYNENIYTIYTKINWRYYVLSKLMQSEGDYAFDIDKAIELGLLVKNDSLIL